VDLLCLLHSVLGCFRLAWLLQIRFADFKSIFQGGKRIVVAQYYGRHPTQMETITMSEMADLFITLFQDFDFCLPSIRQFKDEVKYYIEDSDMDEKYHKLVRKTIQRYKDLYRCILYDEQDKLVVLACDIPQVFVEFIMFWILAKCLVRDKRSGDLMYDCDDMLEKLDVAVEKGHLNEGEYLEMCNRLKLLKSIQDMTYIEELDECLIVID